MASSSSRHVAATRAPPPPDQLAAFYTLVDKKLIAGVLCRYARDAELSLSAAVEAEALFGGDDSLVVAHLRLCESQSLSNLASKASGAEDTLLCRSWAALVSVLPLLLRRVEANTLLPGTVREDEMDYYAHVQATVKKAKKKPLPPPAALRAVASVLGYVTLLDAMVWSLVLLRRPYPAAQKRMVESFVLQGLDVIPRTAGISADMLAGEDDLVAMIDQFMNPRRYEPAFCAAVLCKWRSNAVSSVLRARGVLQTGIDVCQLEIAEFGARQRAGVAKHGLRHFALPSCSTTEKTVKEFAGCSGCRTVV